MQIIRSIPYKLVEKVGNNDDVGNRLLVFMISIPKHHDLVFPKVVGKRIRAERKPHVARHSRNQEFEETFVEPVVSSIMTLPSDQLSQMETTCGSLLYELQVIWDEVGEYDEERDRMLYELEQECLDVYRRRVDQANRSQAELRRAIADSEAELAAIYSALGEPTSTSSETESNQNVKSLKEELKTILPHLEDMRKKKSDRWNQFQEVLEQIQRVSLEIGCLDCNGYNICFDESDLSMKRLEDLHKQLEILQKDKAYRLKQVLDHLNTLNLLSGAWDGFQAYHQ